MADLSEGAEFAGHRIEGIAGRGGMGTVYRARHIALDHLVALKVIAVDLAEDESFRERFKSESRIAVSLRHPNVVPIHHAGEEDGLLFVTMDLIEGPDLRKLLIARGPLDGGVAVRILEQVASALDVAHSRGLVHRDIKPGNILIEERRDDRAYLTDFGLTKRIDAASAATALTSTGAFVGTLDYVAPEQIRGDDLDARTDVYALGCVLYEMLAGKAPFADREEKVAKMYAHLQDDPEPLSGAGEAFNAVIARALSKEPDDRYPSAGDLGRAAAAALEGREVDTAERNVGVGAAAPTATHRTPEEVTRPEPAPDLDATEESPAAGPNSPAETAPPEATQELGDPGEISKRSDYRAESNTREERGERSRVPLTLAALAALAVVGAGLALLLGGGGDEERGTAGEPGASAEPRVAGKPVDGGEFPVGAAADADDVYVADRTGGQLIRAGAGNSRRIGDPVALGDEPEDVAIAGDSVFVTAPARGKVLRFDRDLEASEAIPAEGGPMALTVAEGSVWTVGRENGTVYRLDPDGTAEETPTPATDAFGIAVTDDDLWVVSRTGNEVWRVPRGGGEPEAFAVGENPKGVVVAGGSVFVANATSGDVSVLDEGTGEEVTTVRVGGVPRDTIFFEGRVWVSNGGDGGDGWADILDPADPTSSQRVRVEGSPEGLGAGGGRVWVATGKAGKSAVAIRP